MAGYEIKKGAEAVENATSEKPKYDKVMKSLSSGKSYKVRCLGLAEVVEVAIHSAYEIFNSTPCTKDDVYDKAVALLRKQQKELADAGDEKGAEAIGKHAYALSAKNRYLIGFIDLADGKPMIVDLSKKQAQGVIANIKQYEKNLDKLAFNLSKSGSGQSTIVSFNPIMFLEDELTAEELKNYNASKGASIEAEVYQNCLYVKGTAEQIDDIIAYDRKNKGLNLVERLGLTANEAEGEKEAEPVDQTEEGNYDF